MPTQKTKEEKPVFPQQDTDEGDFYEAIKEIAGSGVVSLAEYFGDQGDRKPIASMAPETFVQREAAKKPTRTKYVCDGCGAKVYGKANLNISCDDCSRPFVSEETY